MKLSCYSLLQRDDDDIQIKYCCCNLLLYHSTVYCISFYVQKSVVYGPCDLSLMNDSEVSAMAKKNMATQIMPGVMNSLKKTMETGFWKAVPTLRLIFKLMIGQLPLILPMLMVYKAWQGDGEC